uniref:Matrix-remodelling associated 5b n=1 Tax=Callorhinchus milii TaxID=7868 RepID=A0A4W3GZN4_CALMI
LARPGWTLATVRLHVSALPPIIGQSKVENVSVPTGRGVHVDCTAKAAPAPKIRWTLPDGTQIKPSQFINGNIFVFPNGTLYIRNATSAHSGHYQCLATNLVGLARRGVSVRVETPLAPARIMAPSPHRVDVAYGSPLHLDCEATGDPHPKILWSLAGRSRRYVVFGNGSLYFNEAGPKDEGEYTCYAVNQIGKDEMRVSVKVVSEPPTIRGDEGPAVLEVPYGESFSLRCEAKGQPQPWLAWFSPFNRYIPPSSAKYRVGNDGTLLVRDGQNTDSGNYTCVARNAAGEGRRVVTVRVRAEPPRIVVADRRLFSGAVTETVLAGARKLIDCQAEGVPSPRVTWLLPGGAPATLTSHRDGGRVTVHANGTLDIRNAGRMDAGRLMCLASNKAGNAKLTVELEVVEEKPAVKPSFADSPSSAGVISAATGGSTVRLDCSSRGSPAPDTVWYLPNAHTPPTQLTSLTLQCCGWR